MESVYETECIIIEFEALKNAINTGLNTNSAIVQILYP